MKLINVDNFLKQYSDQVCGDTIDAIDLRLALLKEPAVEAIPIEWLANFCYKCEEETQQLSEIRLAVETWRKENETSRCR